MLAVLRRGVYRVDGPNLRVIAPGKYSFFWTNVAAVVSRSQHCLIWQTQDFNLNLPLYRRTR